MNSLLLQPLLEHFGIAASVVTGVLAARGQRIDWFGVLGLRLAGIRRRRSLTLFEPQEPAKLPSQSDPTR